MASSEPFIFDPPVLAAPPPPPPAASPGYNNVSTTPPPMMQVPAPNTNSYGQPPGLFVQPSMVTVGLPTGASFTTIAPAPIPTQPPVDARLSHAFHPYGYELSVRGPTLFHLKKGSFRVYSLLGCLTECYKFDVDTSNPQYIRVSSSLSRNACWDPFGFLKEKIERKKVIKILQTRVFPGYQISTSW